MYYTIIAMFATTIANSETVDSRFVKTRCLEARDVSMCDMCMHNIWWNIET